MPISLDYVRVGVSSGPPDENESHYRPVLSRLIVTAWYHYTP
ncbi:hypothetical protein CPL00229_CDS0148 [Escherichia phage vB_Eco_mar004NP2]|uniref:Uncharacterized protein n=1 Tax=Salmonella phage PMBT29 TaxID=3137286 RepID=A0AAU8BX79_9VIRU